jgi:gamma-glutamyltranspeptidase/glutathione hydrolase
LSTDAGTVAKGLIAVLGLSVPVALGLAALLRRYVSRRRVSARERYFSRLEYQPHPPELTIEWGGSVAALHPQARAAGMEILHAGGNAYDAFVATVIAQAVLAEGGTSLAGPLGALTYDAATGKIAYLDACYNTPVDSRAVWRQADGRRSGKVVLAPGALAGLHELAARGKLGFSRLLEPAIRLAAEGFRVHKLYALTVRWQRQKLCATEYGRRTFFRSDGAPARVGDVLVQPELAGFLINLQKHGIAYVYDGDWGRRFLRCVRERGGRLIDADLLAYRARWREPWRSAYRGREIVASAGRSYAGIWSILALKAVERMQLRALGHYSTSARAMELMIRTARHVWGERWLFDCLATLSKRPRCTLDRAEAVQNRLQSCHAEVSDDLPFTGSVRPSLQAGAHSYHVVAVDNEGNIVSGTHTIESNAWGTGWFVEGVPLPESGMVPWGTRPGERRLSALTMHFVLSDGRPEFALGSISNSLVEASFQFLMNVLEYELPISDAVARPRFGTFPSEPDSYKVDWSRNWLDPRIDPRVVATLASRNINVRTKGLVDTGLGTLARVESQ